MDQEQTVLASLENSGVKAVLIPVGSVNEVVGDMISFFHSGSLNPEFASRYEHYFREDWLRDFPEAKSVLLFVLPDYEVELRFRYHGTERKVIVPPGYSYSDLEFEAERLAEQVLQPTGCRYSRIAGVPLKLLAVRSGLCTYGRNNITYCEGMGSHIQIYGFTTELPVPDEFHLRPAQQMPECENCRACLQACPTSCIDADSPVIHAERCLTYVNENGGDFPDWLMPSAHNAIVGCMACQRACPKNRNHLTTRVADNVFSEKEIDLILSEDRFDRLPSETQNTLKKYNLDDYWGEHTLSRNLRVLLEK